MKGYYLRWGVTILLILSVILFCFTSEQSGIFVLVIIMLLAILRVAMSIYNVEKYNFEKECYKYDKAFNDFGSGSLRVPQIERISQIEDNMQSHSATIILSMICIIICGLVIVVLALQVNWSRLFTNLWCFVLSLIEEFPLFEF